MINKILKNEKLMKQISLFLVVGFTSFFIDYLVLYIVHKIFLVDHLIASAIAFSIAVIYNYYASVRFVFEVDEKNSKKKNFILFVTFSIIGLLITELIMYLGVNILHLEVMLVKIFATAVVMVYNFVSRKIFLEKK